MVEPKPGAVPDRDAEPAVETWGLDHHRAAVALRERAAVPAESVAPLAASLAALPGCGEAVVLATCNRLELYLAGSPDRRAVVAALTAHCRAHADELDAVAYRHQGKAAVRHLFRVVSGLESMVLGESEIAGQVKRAYEGAQAAGATGSLLNPLFQRAFSVSKDVRTATSIGDHKLSVASVAVDFARQVLDPLTSRRLLVVGAGETAELAITHLRSAGVTTVTICNRSPERAQELAGRVGAGVIPWSRLGESLGEFDLIVSSTAAQDPVIRADDVRRAVRRRRGSALVLIDLAVPRDIEPAVANLPDAFLFDLDRLEGVVARNRHLRSGEVSAAEALIDAEVNGFVTASHGDQVETMARLATFFRDTTATEEARLVARLGVDLSEAQRKELRYALERIGAKLLHPLLAQAREHAADAAVQQVIRRLSRPR